MVTQPMAFCWDDRGRLWIAENRDYESRVAGFSNDGDSRILILEDTDRDGVADSRKVFLEGIPFSGGDRGRIRWAVPRGAAQSAVRARSQRRRQGRHGRHRGAADRLGHLRIATRPSTACTGAPTAGFTACRASPPPRRSESLRARAGCIKAKEPFPSDLLPGAGVEINGGVWRYHPTRDRFEVVAHGFSNPWGIDYDAKGQLLISACVIPHLFHVIPGGIYMRQGGQHFNPYVYSDIQTIADHRHRSAHGGARIYQSDAFPASQAGRVFMANIHEHAVLSDVLERKGSGFTAHHGDDFMIANNAHWIGFSLEIGPDGTLYVLDWHDGDICGQDITAQGHRPHLPDRAEAVARERRGPAATAICGADRRRARRAAGRARATGTPAAPASSCRAAPPSGKLRPAVQQQLRELFIKARQRRTGGCARCGRCTSPGLWTPDTLIADPRRLGRVHPCLGGAAHHRRRHAVAAGARHASCASPARTPRRSSASISHRRCSGSTKTQRWPLASALMARGEDADDTTCRSPVARRRTAGARQSGARARARRPQQHPAAGAVHRPPRRRCRQRRGRRGRDRRRRQRR